MLIQFPLLLILCMRVTVILNCTYYFLIFCNLTNSSLYRFNNFMYSTIIVLYMKWLKQAIIACFNHFQLRAPFIHYHLLLYFHFNNAEVLPFVFLLYSVYVCLYAYLFDLFHSIPWSPTQKFSAWLHASQSYLSS